MSHDRRLFRATLLSGLFLSAASPALAQHVPFGEDFAGTIGDTRATSKPAFPRPAQAPKSAPNVVLILIDDAGFAASSAFGGLAKTPAIEALAAEGVRYNRFHTTGICSPTRAALLTGRNQHQVGFGNLTNVAAGFPAYNGIWKKETASLPRVLQLGGYSTAAFGKWHNTPAWEVSAAGPFDHWPTGLGFDHFYGFLEGDDNQWEPHLFDDTRPVEYTPPPESGYHLTTDLVNKAIGWVDDHEALAAQKPYFLYFATGAVHMPHHVPAEWIARNKGRYDAGWDKFREETFARQKKLGVIPADAKLTPRPAGLPAWDSLSPDERRLYAHQMEVFSAYLEQTDYELGRLVKELRARPGGDNLMVITIVGDNGGSAEGDLGGSMVNEQGIAVGAPNDLALQLANIDKQGSPEVGSHYAAGWAWATSTPFQWMKQVASHFGGTRNPLIIDWPGHTSQPQAIRGQFGHVNDIAPTVLEAAGLSLPAAIDGVPQLPLEGKSLLPSLTDPKAAETHTEQYFEIFGNRAIYKDGWVAAAKRDYSPWNLLRDIPKIYADNTDKDRWELYHVASDFSEATDLAAKEPAKLEELKAEFTREGKRNGVFPLVPLPLGAPTIANKAARHFEFRSDISGLTISALPQLIGRAHRFGVQLAGDPSAANGVLIAHGGRLGGYVLYLDHGKLVFENNVFNQKREVLATATTLPAGTKSVGFEFVPTVAGSGSMMPFTAKVTGGTIRLLVDGHPAGESAVSLYPDYAGSFNETFDIGKDRGSRVSKTEIARAPATVAIDRVTLDLP